MVASNGLSKYSLDLQYLIRFICICENNKNEILFYTFNPYSSLASKFWTSMPNDHIINEHWTLFQLLPEERWQVFNDFGE